MHKEEEVDSRGKRIKTPNEVKPLKNINENPRSFLGMSFMQKEDPTSHKLQDNAYK